jgi:hypothetical protein
MIEKFSEYHFSIKKLKDNKWIYFIYPEGCYPYDDGVIESDDYYEAEQEARFAAIGHITKLENGERS